MSNVIEIKSVSKKFCRHQRRALIYGACDIIKQTIWGRREMSLLRAGEFWALRNISAVLPRGKSLGLIGANGSGKTTLLKIISGLLVPDTGSVTTAGKITSLFAKGAGFNPLLSGRENIILNLVLFGMSLRDAAIRAESVIEFAELPKGALDAPIKTYSSGMVARLGFACAVNATPEVLIIDEALAVGDMRFRTKCYRKLSELRKSGTSFIMVSHSLNAIVANCDLGLYLKDGEIKCFGEIRSVVKYYENDIINPSPNVDHPSKYTISNDQIKIISIRVDSEEKNVLLSGKHGKIQVIIYSQSFFENVNIGLIIRDRSGDLGTILNFDTVSDQVKLTLSQGYNIITINLPVCVLRAGLYELKMYISLGLQYNIHAALESFPLRVAQGKEMIECLFYQPHGWEAIQAGEL